MNKHAAIAAVIAHQYSGACEAPQPVDLILTDARTSRAGDSLPSTLVIDNGRILAVGDASLLERLRDQHGRSVGVLCSWLS